MILSKLLKRIILMLVMSALMFTGIAAAQQSIQGRITDNGGDYLGGGAEAVANALVTVTDLSDTTVVYTAVTDEQGYYSVIISSTDVNEDDALPLQYALSQNYPNPFNPATIIAYSVPVQSTVSLTVYNVLGQQVRSLIHGVEGVGHHEVLWDAADDAGRGVPAGVYIYVLKAGKERISRKMVLLDGQQGAIHGGTGIRQRGNVEALAKHAALYRVQVTGEHNSPLTISDVEISGEVNRDISVERVVSDVDGNVYKTVKIGNQWWMAENLRVMHLADGTLIDEAVDQNSAWEDRTTASFCAYDYQNHNVNEYGYLYNWYTVCDWRGLVPEGWHVPTDSDWNQMMAYLGGSDEAGGKLKEAGEDHWGRGNVGATNEAGFNGLPGGTRGRSGGFNAKSTLGVFWSGSSECDTAAFYYLWDSDNDLNAGRQDKAGGYSIRLVRDTNWAGHNVSQPYGPHGPAEAFTRDTLTFAAAGSMCNADHEVSYRFDWGDGSMTDFAGDTQEHVYTAPGVYQVKVQALCSNSNTVMSEWSPAVNVAIDGVEIGSMTGNDGQVYKTVKIGDQWWMAENLRETQFRDGSGVPIVENDGSWSILNYAARCSYNNNAGAAATHGYLYNFMVVAEARQIAPEGWRVPTDQDWKVLERYLGVPESEIHSTGGRGADAGAGSKLKAVGTSMWAEPNDGTDEYEFTALPSGQRVQDGKYKLAQTHSAFWSTSTIGSDDAWYRALVHDEGVVLRNHCNRRYGFSIRLVKED